MTTYSFPSVTPSRIRPVAINNDTIFRSPGSGFVQAAGRNGARWGFDLTFQNLNTPDQNAICAFFLRLYGRQHRFTMTPYGHSQQGILTGTPQVDGANQTGTTLSTKGWTISQTGIIKAGDWLAYQNSNANWELKRCTADANSDGTGLADIEIWPEIHTSPANSATIVVSSPLGTFMLADPTFGWDMEPADFASFTVQILEDIA